MPGVIYNKEYWIACKDHNTGEMFRVRRFGRRHEINGRTYYESRSHLFTDGESGMLVPCNVNVRTVDPEAVENFVVRQKFKLMDLPIRVDLDEYD